jgi:hypothetical protein
MTADDGVQGSYLVMPLEPCPVNATDVMAPLAWIFIGP